MINADEFCKIYADYYGVTQRDAVNTHESVFSLLKKLLYVDGQDVSFHKFGSFRQKVSAPKSVRHPKTGNMTVIPRRVVVKFSPSETPF